MTYEEFRRQIGKAGLTVKEFAALIKQTPNSITNYSSQGEVPSHLAIISALMGDMADHGLNFREALARIQFESSKPRGGAAKGKFGGDRQRDLNLSRDSSWEQE